MFKVTVARLLTAIVLTTATVAVMTGGAVPPGVSWT
jgi:hypothetical protein